MPSKLTRICFAAMLACAGSPAYAAGMPDTGTKNFVPGGDAPAYLVNENLTVAPGSPGQSPLGTAYNEPTGPASEPASVARSPQTRTIRHARLAGRRAGIRRSAAARTVRIAGRPVRAAKSRDAQNQDAQNQDGAGKERGGARPERAAIPVRAQCRGGAANRLGKARSGERSSRRREIRLQAGLSPAPFLRLGGGRWTGPAAPPYNRAQWARCRF